MLSEQKMKNLIDKKSKETNLPKQQLYGLFALEQLLVKLNDSQYKDKLIIKGGYLLSSIYGLDNRSTRDLDTTVINFPLTWETMEEIATFISTPDRDGEQHFELRGIKETREDFDYNGYELKLLYKNGRSKFPISVDFTTGEDLISIEEGREIPLMFEKDKKVELPSYYIEQILTDKFYTTLVYGKYDDTNSRMKDYYDIYLLTSIGENIDYSLIDEGLAKTMEQRDELIDSDEFSHILSSLAESKNQQLLWKRYRSVTPFAKDIEFHEVIEKVFSLSDNILSVENTQEKNIHFNNDDNFER